jgi:HD superfamily phosphohydrolase
VSDEDPLLLLRRRVSAVLERLIGHYQPRYYRGRKVIRDVIWGMIDVYPHELALVDCPLFQRLRGISQTSLAFLTYPSSGHSRFEHSLGALAVADRVLRSLRERVEISQKEVIEVRLAALLHDCTHGPLSHTSESFYRSNPIFAKIKKQYSDLFKNASPSEILTYCTLTSDLFQGLWKQIVNQYEGNLSEVDIFRIATMIIGAEVNSERPASSISPTRRFLRQLINGPFDVDKLDYIARDGYFTGLSLGIDVERLLWVLDTFESKADAVDRTNPVFLCVSASGATVLEQILFAKMQLFSSIYHHHKVRVAHDAALRLIAYLSEAGMLIKGMPLTSPETFIALEDSDLLHGCFAAENDHARSDALQKAVALASAIRNRTLPMRALVLTFPVWGQDSAMPEEDYRKEWANLLKSADQPGKLATQIADRAGVDRDQVWVDTPDTVNLQGTGQEGLIKFDENTALPIQQMFPIGGWLSAYQSYRMISYIFTWGDRKKVGEVAREILEREYSIVINDVALKLARID